MHTKNALPNCPVAIPGRRRGSHGVALDGRRLEAEAADRRQEEDRPRGLPNQVQEGRQAQDALHGKNWKCNIHAGIHIGNLVYYRAP